MVIEWWEWKMFTDTKTNSGLVTSFYNYPRELICENTNLLKWDAHLKIGPLIILIPSLWAHLFATSAHFRYFPFARAHVLKCLLLNSANGLCHVAQHLAPRTTCRCFFHLRDTKHYHSKTQFLTTFLLFHWQLLLLLSSFSFSSFLFLFLF